MLQFLVGLLDRWLDCLVGPSWRDPEPRCHCPICRDDVFYARPHLHGQWVVRLTDWPEPGVLVTLEPKEPDGHA